MADKKEFHAVIKESEKWKNAAYLEIPFDVPSHFGKARVKIKASFDGIEYRGLLTRMYGEYKLILRKDIRAKLAKGFGDSVHVILEEDLEPRIVEVPSYVLDLLNTKKEAKQIFESLSYTNKKEYIQWITGAKKPETRERRLNQFIELLEKGSKTK